MNRFRRYYNGSWVSSGSLSLVLISYPMFLNCPEQTRDQKSKTDRLLRLVGQHGNLDEFGEFLYTLVSWIRDFGLVGLKESYRYEVSKAVSSFRSAKVDCRNLQNISIMRALRGKEERTAKEQQLELKKHSSKQTRETYLHLSDRFRSQNGQLQHSSSSATQIPSQMSRVVSWGLEEAAGQRLGGIRS